MYWLRCSGQARCTPLTARHFCDSHNSRPITTCVAFPFLPVPFLFALFFAGADVAVPRCVIAAEPDKTYDLNSWAETPSSRKRVAKLNKMVPLFEGYDGPDTAPAGVFYGRDAKFGQCKWQQTGGCDPNGQREFQYDLDCDQTVDAGASGYCHCADGSRKGWFVRARFMCAAVRLCNKR